MTAPGAAGTPEIMTPRDEPLILASSSPRRRMLLAQAGVAFEVRPPEIGEQQWPGEAPAAFALRIARAKATEVARRAGPQPVRRVLGADTVVVIDEDTLGKPEGPEHAVALLRRLTGRVHRVITAVALVESASLEGRHVVVESRVTLRPASPAELRAYVATGEPLDKAGAYAAQGEGRRFIERIEGSETNVIGLPLEETLALLGGPPAGDGF